MTCTQDQRNESPVTNTQEYPVPCDSHTGHEATPATHTQESAEHRATNTGSITFERMRFSRTTNRSWVVWGCGPPHLLLRKRRSSTTSWRRTKSCMTQTRPNNPRSAGRSAPRPGSHPPTLYSSGNRRPGSCSTLPPCARCGAWSPSASRLGTCPRAPPRRGCPRRRGCLGAMLRCPAPPRLRHRLHCASPALCDPSASDSEGPAEATSAAAVLDGAAPE